jgi:hypothetical protein
LNRVAIRLALPSGKRCSVVGYGELKPRRHLIVLANLFRRILIARVL